MQGIKRRLDRLEKTAATGTAGTDIDWTVRSRYAEELLGTDSDLRDFVSVLIIQLFAAKALEMPDGFLPGCSNARTRLEAWKLEHSPELRDASRLLVEKMLDVDGNVRVWIRRGLVFIGKDGQPMPLLDAFMTRDVAEIIISEHKRRQLIEEHPEEQAEIERLEKKRDGIWTALRERLETNPYLNRLER